MHASEEGDRSQTDLQVCFLVGTCAGVYTPDPHTDLTEPRADPLSQPTVVRTLTGISAWSCRDIQRNGLPISRIVVWCSLRLGYGSPFSILCVVLSDLEFEIEKMSVGEGGVEDGLEPSQDGETS